MCCAGTDTTCLAVPAAAQVATGPVVVALSSSVALLSVPANLLAVPAVAPATVAGVLAARVAGEPPCETVRRDLGAHLATVREQIARLQALEAQLVTRLTYAEAHPDPACDSTGCVYLEDHAQA